MGRLHLNDVYLHFSHFYWTTLTYLGPFFLVQLALVCIYSSSQRILPIILGLVIYLVEVNDFLVGNYALGLGSLNYWDFNNLLTNNLNKYHPHIFYISTICFLSSLSLGGTSRNYKGLNFMNSYLYTYINASMSFVAKVNFFALFLGSWWAFQEGTWGGWWNWDPSEVLGALILLTTILIMHQLSGVLTVGRLLMKIKIGVYVFILVYFFTQLNFDLVSHNFGNRFTFFFTNTLFYLEAVFFWSIIIIYCIRLFFQQIIQYLSYKQTIYRGRLQPILVSLLSLLWIWVVITSFTPLCNYFLWQYFRINAFNTLANYQLTLYIVVLILTLTFNLSNSYTKLGLNSLVSTYLPSVFLTSLVFWRNKFTIIELFHNLIVIMLIANLVSNQIETTTILEASKSGRLLVNEKLLHPSHTIYVCEDEWREAYYMNLSPNSTPHLSFTLSSKSNTNETNLFNLLHSNEFFDNLYQILDSYLNTHVFMSNLYFLNLYEVLMIGTLSLPLLSLPTKRYIT